MRTGSYTAMEMVDVDYTQIPHAILKFKLNGFSVEDIVKVRVSAHSYNLFARRKQS